MAKERPRKIAIVDIDSYRCIGCGVCVQSCPNDVIRMKRGKAYIAYQYDCSACFACEVDCPREAVSLGFTCDLISASGDQQSPLPSSGQG